MLIKEFIQLVRVQIIIKFSLLIYLAEQMLLKTVDPDQLTTDEYMYPKHSVKMGLHCISSMKTFAVINMISRHFHRVPGTYFHDSCNENRIFCPSLGPDFSAPFPIKKSHIFSQHHVHFFSIFFFFFFFFFMRNNAPYQNDS